MREVRDSFLKFLADNISQTTVKAVRRDPDDPAADKISVNCVNVSFGRMTLDNQKSTQVAIIDVCADKELDALNIVNQVWQLLSAAYFTPQLNYAIPSSPTPTGSNLYWEKGKVQFNEVYSDFYFHYTCQLSLMFTPVSYHL